MADDSVCTSLLTVSISTGTKRQKHTSEKGVCRVDGEDKRHPLRSADGERHPVL